MGISVKLNVYWDDVEPQAWAAAYDETLRLLRSHPSQLMGYTWRSVLAARFRFTPKISSNGKGMNGAGVSSETAKACGVPRVRVGIDVQMDRREMLADRH